MNADPTQSSVEPFLYALDWNRLSFFEHKCPVSSDTSMCVYVCKTVQTIFNQPLINFLFKERQMRVFYVIFKKWIIKETVLPGGQEFRNISFYFNLNFWYMFSYRIPFSPTNHESYKSLLMVEVHCLHSISVFKSFQNTRAHLGTFNSFRLYLF